MGSKRLKQSANEPPEPILSVPDATSIVLHRTTVVRRQCGLLSNAQEKTLLAHIDRLTQYGLPPNRHNIHVFARNICAKEPGVNWASKFMKRYSQ